jgi:hypothetical protein
MKKITKTSKTPAPATKTSAPPAAKKTATVPKIKKSAAAPAVVTKPKGSRVTLVAKIDIGFGNKLFVRGSGDGLSWDAGTSLDCTGSDTWTLVLPAVSSPIAFKFLVNDLTWSLGEDYTAAPGDTVTVTPAF